MKVPTIVSGRPICIAVGCTDTMLFREEARFISLIRETISQYFGCGIRAKIGRTCPS
jgi:hypothetical protein